MNTSDMLPIGAGAPRKRSPRCGSWHLLVVTLTVALGWEAAHAQELHRVTAFHHRTTSDWSEFTLSPEPTALALGEVLENADHPGLEIFPSRIAKPAYDATPITVEHLLLIPEATESITLTSRKGDIGESWLQLLGADPSVEFVNETSGAGANEQTFIIGTDVLETLPTVVLSDGIFASPTLLHATLVLDTSSDWTRFEFLSDAAISTAVRGIVMGEEAPGLHVGPNGLNKEQFDETRVVVEYDLFLDRVPEVFVVVSTKGCVGQTTLTTATDAGSVSRENNVCDDELALLFPTAWAAGASVEDFSAPQWEPRVLAFYYPWYGSLDGPEGEVRHWPEGYTNTPSLGEYSSRAESTLSAHMAWFEQAGIDALIVSWWGINSYGDITLREYLAPALEGGPTDFCVYVEAASNLVDLRSQLIHVFQTLAPHERHLRIDGRPVVFIYGRVMGQFTAEQFGQVFQDLRNQGHDGFFIADSFNPSLLDVFDGLHTYNPVGMVLSDPDGIAQTYQSAWLSCRLRDRLFVATVLPGYDDSHLTPPRPNPIVLPREDGDVYRSIWEQTIRSLAEWCAVCTFNEFHEGSEIEPTVESGDLYLTLTREWGDRFRQRWASTLTLR